MFWSLEFVILILFVIWELWFGILVPYPGMQIDSIWIIALTLTNPCEAINTVDILFLISIIYEFYIYILLPGPSRSPHRGRKALEGSKKGVIFITAGNKSWVLSLKSFGFGDTACPLMIQGCFHAFKAFEMTESYPAEVGDWYALIH